MRDRSRILTNFTAAALLGLGALLGLFNCDAPGFGTPSATAHAQRPVSNGVIAFVGGATNASLDTINSTGTRLRTLAYCRTTACVIADYVWSHDGRRIAFVRGRSNVYGLSHSDLSIFVVNADGSGERRLASCGHPSGCYGEALSWSPDSTRLAVARSRALFVLNVKTGALRRLTHCGSSCTDIFPEWSPDGSKIAFSRSMTMCEGGCPSTPYVVNQDGSGLRKLANVIGGANNVSWSPDGQSIAFGDGGFGEGGLYTVDANGSHLKLLVPAPPARANRISFGVVWEPFGSRILFWEVPGSEPSSAKALAWVINAQGGGRRLLYHTGCCGGLVDMTWSPNGGRIAISETTYADSHDTVNPRKSGFFVMNADGSHVQRILFQTVTTPAWQPVP